MVYPKFHSRVGRLQGKRQPVDKPSLVPMMQAWIVAFGMLALSMTPIDAAAQQQVSLRADDGWVLSADVYGTGPHGLVLIHGGRLTKESWRPQAKRFQAAGYHVVALDLRGFGLSQAVPAAGASEDRKELDVVAAVAYLKQHGALEVSLIGGSMGGDAAADAAAALATGAVDCLVLLSSAGGARPDQVKARKILVVAARDDQRSAGERRWPNIEAGYKRVPVPKSVLLLEGTAHAQAIFDTPDGDAVTAAILQFLSE